MQLFCLRISNKCAVVYLLCFADNRYQFARTLHPKINYGGPLRVGTPLRIRLERPKDRGDTVEWSVTDLLTAGTPSVSGWDEGNEGVSVTQVLGHADDSVEGKEIGTVTAAHRDTITVTVRTQSGNFTLQFSSAAVTAKVPNWSPHKGGKTFKTENFYSLQDTSIDSLYLHLAPHRGN